MVPGRRDYLFPSVRLNRKQPLFTDMIMEGKSGMECFREMKKINPSVHAVLSSGYGLSAEISDIVKEGMRGVIQKPFDIVQFSQVVAEALKGKPEMVHVILTGRNAHPLLVELADTVTEMREVKHAYQKGILAQRGIEF